MCIYGYSLWKERGGVDGHFDSSTLSGGEDSGLGREEAMLGEIGLQTVSDFSGGYWRSLGSPQ